MQSSPKMSKDQYSQKSILYKTWKNMEIFIFQVAEVVAAAIPLIKIINLSGFWKFSFEALLNPQ